MSFLAQPLQQNIASSRGIAQLEAPHGLARNAPPLQVSQRPFAFGRIDQDVMIKRDSIGHGGTQGFQIRPGRGIFCTRDLRERDAVALSQQTNRFRKCDVLDEHRKLENIAANPAAEAHEDLFFGIHVEGRGLFVVKRAARDVVPASLFEGDVLGNERDDID